MRAWFVGSALATSVLSTAPAGAAHPAVAVQEAWVRAYAAADEEAMRLLLRDDATIGESSGTILRKAEVLSRAELPSVGLTMNLSEVAVREYGPVAVVTALVAEVRGQGKTDFRITETYVRGGKTWQLAASHWTRVLDKPTEIALDAAALDRLVGTYRTPRGVPITVARNGARLAIAAGEAAPSTFLAISPTQFSAPNGRVRWQFISDLNGKVNQAVIVNQNVITMVQRETGSDLSR